MEITILGMVPKLILQSTEMKLAFEQVFIHLINPITFSCLFIGFSLILIFSSSFFFNTKMTELFRLFFDDANQFISASKKLNNEQQEELKKLCSLAPNCALLIGPSQRFIFQIG